jgi:hypothetical protein
MRSRSPAAEQPASQSILAANFSQQAGIGVDDTDQLDTPRPPDGAAGAPSLGISFADPAMQAVVALGVSLTEYTRLNRFRKLQTELCQGAPTDCDDADLAQPQEKELRLRCIELLLRLKEDLGCVGLAPSVVSTPPPTFDCVSEVYMNLLSVVSGSPRSVLACTVLLTELRRRLG